MPRNGSGQYNLPYDWNDDKANGIKVLASRMQNQDQDIADALTASLTSDGQTPYTGDQDFAGNKAINLGDGTDSQDATVVGQTQTGELQYYGVSSTVPLGVAGVNYEVDATPTLPAYVDGLSFNFIAHLTCSADPKLRAGTLAQLTLVKTDAAGATTALVAGDMILNNVYRAYYHSTIGATKLVILNPEKPFINLANATDATTSIKGKSLLPSPIIIANNSGTPNTNIDFSAGNAISSDGSVQMVASALTKILNNSGSWTAGNNQNGLFTGARANSTWYHCFVINDPTNNLVDFGFDTSVGAANRPVAYTKFRRVGTIRTDSSGNIIAFFSDGRQTTWVTPIQDIQANNPGTSAQLRSLSVPPGIKVYPIACYSCIQVNAPGALIYILVTSPDQTDSTPSGSLYSFTVGNSTGGTTQDIFIPVRTNVSSQVRVRFSASSTNTNSVITTYGWIDNNI